MQRFSGFLAIYSGLKNKRAIVRKTKKQKGKFQLTPAINMRRNKDGSDTKSKSVEFILGGGI